MLGGANPLVKLEDGIAQTTRVVWTEYVAVKSRMRRDEQHGQHHHYTSFLKPTIFELRTLNAKLLLLFCNVHRSG